MGVLRRTHGWLLGEDDGNPDRLVPGVLGMLLGLGPKLGEFDGVEVDDALGAAKVCFLGGLVGTMLGNSEGNALALLDGAKLGFLRSSAGFLFADRGEEDGIGLGPGEGEDNCWVGKTTPWEELSKKLA